MSALDRARAAALARLREEGARTRRMAPASALPQPLHVVYGGAHLFKKDTLDKVGALARKSFATHAPDAITFADALGIPAEIATEVHERVTRKLAAAPVEDYRIDFEDGYGLRGDDEEDAHADAAADALGALLRDGAAPRIGFRIKALAPETRDRALRTLERFLTRLAPQAPLPPGFVVTLPKVRAAAEVEALATMLEALESALGIAQDAIAVELMVETPEALFDDEGRAALPALVRAARGRCTAAHLGSYDYTASIGVAAHEQRLTHPACDFAKYVIQATLAGTGVAFSDGATTLMPIEPHRGADPTPAERAENTRAVHAAWRLHADNVRHGLAQGFYQGWDLHPAQIPARYGAVFAFFATAAPAMEARLHSFLDRAAQATRVGQAFDDAATGQGLLNFFARAARAGALDERSFNRLGVSREAVEKRSFDDLVRGRTAGGSI